jgi:hypothetical protein
MIVVSALAAVSIAVAPVRAHEPDGVIVFQSEGVVTAKEGTPGFAPGEKLVRIVLRSVRDLSGVLLTHQAPAEIIQRLATVRTGAAAARVIDPFEGSSAAILDLGKLSAGTPVTLEFAEDFAEGSGGIVAFTVEAVGVDGKLYHEAYGQVIGTPAKQGVLRNGAIEYPAHEVPTEEAP